MFVICRTDDDTRHRDRYVKNKFFANASKYGIVIYSLDVKLPSGALSAIPYYNCITVVMSCLFFAF